MRKLWYGPALALGQGVEGTGAGCRSGLCLLVLLSRGERAGPRRRSPRCAPTTRASRPSRARPCSSCTRSTSGFRPPRNAWRAPARPARARRPARHARTRAPPRAARRAPLAEPPREQAALPLRARDDELARRRSRREVARGRAEELDDYNRVAAAERRRRAPGAVRAAAARHAQATIGAREQALAATTAAAVQTVTELQQLRRAASRTSASSRAGAPSTPRRSRSSRRRRTPRSSARTRWSRRSSTPRRSRRRIRGLGRPVGLEDAHRHRHGLRPPGPHLDRPARRLGDRRRRPVGDPARHAHRRPGLRRRGRGRHRRRDPGGDDRPLVPDRRAGLRLGPPDGHDRRRVD